MNWEREMIGLLSASLLRPVLLAFAAAALLLAFRIRHPASRHAVWAAVLIGVVMVPVVSVIAPHWMAPVLPAPRASATLPSSPVAAPAIIAASAPERNPGPLPRSAPRPARKQPPTLLWIYFAGVLAMLVYRLIGWTLLRRVVSRSRPLRSPSLRESPDVSAPVAVGLWHPVVLLPPTWRDWSIEKRTAVLAHEFAHIRRRDPLVSGLAQCAKCIFWFHPLTWWLARKLSELAELACDAAALERVPDPGTYSRILLEFASTVNRGRSRVTLPGLAMAANADMRKRIDQAFKLSAVETKKLPRPALALAIVGLPLVCLAATTELGRARAPQSKPPAPAPRVEEPLIAQATPSRPTAPPRQDAPARQPAAPVRPAPAPPAPLSTALAPVRGPHFVSGSIELAGPPVSGELCWGGCGGPGSPYPESQNEITYRHFTLRKILLRAYNLQDFQITGPPSMNTVPYNVAAMAPVGTTKEQFQVMLQNLLAEQIHLAVHVDKRDFPIAYDLLVAEGGAKLQKADMAVAPPGTLDVILAFPKRLSVQMRPQNDGTPDVIGSLSMASGPLSIADVAEYLGRVLGATVHDKTRMAGRYDIPLGGILFWPPDRPVGPLRVGYPMVRGFIESRLAQLGLRLEEERGRVDFMTVDSFDTAPPAK